MSAQTFGTSPTVAAVFAQQAKNLMGATIFDEISSFGKQNEYQVKIRRAIKMNERKARSQSGKHRGRKWLMSKQAQCALYGHVHSRTGKACYFCGWEFL